MRRFIMTTFAALGILLGTIPVVRAGNTLVPGDFYFSYFNLLGLGSTTLQTNHINDLGVIVGEYSISAGAHKGYVRSANGQLTTIVDPQDKGGQTKGYTVAFGNNAEGTVVGEFLNTQLGYYQGFFYINGMFTNYSLPGLPTGSNTAISGINEIGDFCGYYDTPNSPPLAAFLSQAGKIIFISVTGSTAAYADSINDFDFVTGIYQDSGGKSHGFLRDPKGNVSTVDVPGAAGMVYLGINNFGWVSGNFMDSSSISHGFIGVPNGNSYEFFQIDVPGAAQTTGGGLNDFGVVPGHYFTSTGQQLGYIAFPR
jgi:hypothetical protein